VRRRHKVAAYHPLPSVQACLKTGLTIGRGCDEVSAGRRSPPGSAGNGMAKSATRSSDANLNVGSQTGRTEPRPSHTRIQ
jgi:hypothetical protein